MCEYLHTTFAAEVTFLIIIYVKKKKTLIILMIPDNPETEISSWLFYEQKV